MSQGQNICNIIGILLLRIKYLLVYFKCDSFRLPGAVKESRVVVAFIVNLFILASFQIILRYLYTSYELPYGEQTNLNAYNIIIHELRIFLYYIL